MKNINTASLDCGIDGVNIKFLSEFETEQELYYFQRSNSNRTIKYGLLKKLGLKKWTGRIFNIHKSSTNNKELEYSTV